MTPIDEDYLLAHAREQQAAAFLAHSNRTDVCPRCPHGWHGLACATPTSHSSCLCPSSFEVAS